MAFEKGKSGNPGGRPKENEEIKRLAQEYCPEAIARLATLMHDKNSRTSVAACAEILNRGYGKPPQALEHSGSIGMTHEEALAAINGDGADDAG